MKTIILNQPEQFTLTDTREPEPAPPEEALVKVHRVGICGTDLHAFRGRQPFFEYPRILGHELGVEIIEVPDNDLGLKPGDYCAVEPYLNCGTCIACRQGKTNCCTTLTAFSGMHFHFQAGVAFPGTETDFSIDKALDFVHPIEDSLNQHPCSFL
jgi:threonine dehydrogenase-like Zn-dependent dehydrogenase